METILKILTISLFIISCDNSGESNLDEKNKISIHRIEDIIFNKPPDSAVLILNTNYPEFFDIYAKNVIGVNSKDDPALPQYLKAFTTDPTIEEVFKKCEATFTDLSDLEIQFGNAFNNYSEYFPEFIVPQLMSFVSGFSYTIIVDDNLMAIGLDMYLGENCEYYPRLGIPQYKFRKMNRNQIVSDCMKGWISTEYTLPETENDLIDFMIYHGITLYITDLILPNEDDNVIIGYSPEQLKWCIDNEAEIWFHFIDRELLYKKENALVIKYMGEAPFTPGFPEGSPGEIGKWIGWQIVNKYMEENPEITPMELMSGNLISEEILTNSHYKPNK